MISQDYPRKFSTGRWRKHGEIMTTRTTTATTESDCVYDLQGRVHRSNGNYPLMELNDEYWPSSFSAGDDVCTCPPGGSLGEWTTKLPMGEAKSGHLAGQDHQLSLSCWVQCVFCTELNVLSLGQCNFAFCHAVYREMCRQICRFASFGSKESTSRGSPPDDTPEFVCRTSNRVRFESKQLGNASVERLECLCIVILLSAVNRVRQPTCATC